MKKVIHTLIASIVMISTLNGPMMAFAATDSTSPDPTFETNQAIFYEDGDEIKIVDKSTGETDILQQVDEDTIIVTREDEDIPIYTVEKDEFGNVYVDGELAVKVDNTAADLKLPSLPVTSLAASYTWVHVAYEVQGSVKLKTLQTSLATAVLTTMFPMGTSGSFIYTVASALISYGYNPTYVRSSVQRRSDTLTTFRRYTALYKASNYTGFLRGMYDYSYRMD